MLSSKFLIRLKRQICPQFGARVKRSNLEGGKFPHISPTRRGSMVGGCNGLEKEEKCEVLLQGTRLPCNHLAPSALLIYQRQKAEETMSSGTKQFLIGCPNVSWLGKKYVGGADKELSVKKHKCIARGLWGESGRGYHHICGRQI